MPQKKAATTPEYKFSPLEVEELSKVLDDFRHTEDTDDSDGAKNIVDAISATLAEKAGLTEDDDKNALKAVSQPLGNSFFVLTLVGSRRRNGCSCRPRRRVGEPRSPRSNT